MALFSGLKSRPTAESYAPRARRADPPTSHVAAVSAKRLAKEHLQKIRLALQQGPATIYEIGDRAALNHVQVARRMKELEADGIARPQRAGDANVTRPSPNGCPCRVWERC